jgi:hypothetical protein
MPNQSIFETLRQRVTKSHGLLPAEQRAMFWFRNYSQALTQWQTHHHAVDFDRLQRNDFSKQLVGSTQAWPGYLYFFLYDPKLAKTLPFYDQFPFVLVLDRGDDSFLGLNFHYLDYQHRAMFFDLLYELRENRHGQTTLAPADDLRMRLHVTYDILQLTTQYKMFRPCLKRYLFTQIQSPLLKVGASEWDVALFLPVESFVKESKTTVWTNSESKF